MERFKKAMNYLSSTDTREIGKQILIGAGAVAAISLFATLVLKKDEPEVIEIATEDDLVDLKDPSETPTEN